MKRKLLSILLTCSLLLSTIMSAMVTTTSACEYDIGDALEILKFLAEFPNTAATVERHDLNRNGHLDISDAIVILKYLAEIDVLPECDCPIPCECGECGCIKCFPENDGDCGEIYCQFCYIVDYDLTKMSPDDVIIFINEELYGNKYYEYKGKTIKVSGEYFPDKHGELQQHYIDLCTDTACAFLEFKWKGEHTYPDDYPNPGTTHEHGDSLLLIGVMDYYIYDGYAWPHVLVDEIIIKDDPHVH